mmetsp:Transcript_9458/g.13022  ORF Transcript_9458/g.13022 Transcript_9458/m.13022 type:complete len:98 (+) Transcript_9458:33-326(+)
MVILMKLCSAACCQEANAIQQQKRHDEFSSKETKPHHPCTSSSDPCVYKCRHCRHMCELSLRAPLIHSCYYGLLLIKQLLNNYCCIDIVIIVIFLIR